MSRPSMETRFWSKVDKDGLDGCWLWRGQIMHGYGYFAQSHSQKVRAHRLAYELVRGPIEEGLTLDHLCRNRACVNPAHLEAVTNQVNVLRGTSPAAIHAAKSHCVHGHEYTPENTIQTKKQRQCRTCKRAADREAWRRKASKA